MNAAFPTTAPGQFTPAMLTEILQYVPPHPPYEKWILIVSAVASVLPEQEAVQILASWSPEKEEGEYARKIRHRLTKVGIGSLIALAKEHGFDASDFARRTSRSSQSARCQSGTPKRVPHSPVTPPAVSKRRDFVLRPGRPSELDTLANLRRLPSSAGLFAMQSAGCLAFTDSLRDHSPDTGWQSVTSWVVTDPTHRNQSARRLDGAPWRCLGNSKSRCLSGPGSKAWPVGITLAKPGQRLDVVEGEGDFVALWHLHTIAEASEAAPVALLGTGARIENFAADLAPMVSGRVVQVFPHIDANGAGRRAAEKWAGSFYRLGAAEVRLRDLRAWLGAGGKDLNDTIVAQRAETGMATFATLCPTCMARGVIAPAGGPTCTCQPYAWPDFSTDQIAAEINHQT